MFSTDFIVRQQENVRLDSSRYATKYYYIRVYFIKGRKSGFAEIATIKTMCTLKKS